MPRPIIASPACPVAALFLAIGSALTSGAAGCGPAGEAGPPPASPSDTAPRSNDAREPSGRPAVSAATPILGPEASSISYEQLARYPAPGVRLPKGIQYSPDGKFITYLQSETKGAELTLFAFDIASRSAKPLARAADLIKDAKPISREEELRRERQRQMAQGVTSYQWAERAPVMIIPHGGDVFLRAESGAITRLTETAEPEIDPKVCSTGERIAFVRGSELYSVDVATRRETKLTKGAPEGVTRGLSDFNGQEEFDEPSGFWMSPDCSKIAYLEVDEREVGTVPVMGYRGGKADLMMQKYPLAGEKNPKVRAGVLDVKTQKTTWLKWPKDEQRYLGRFTWSRDGKSVWLQTLSRDQKRLALVRAEAASGNATEVIVETSATWIDFASMKLLEQSPRLLWTKLVGGHTHLELRDAETGGVLEALTSGEWDVDQLVAVDEQRDRVLFNGTKDGPVDRQLYSVPLTKTGEIKRLTTEPGAHFAITPRDGKGFVDLHSATNRLWKVVLRDENGAEIAELPAPVDPELASLKLRSVEIITVRGPSGDTLYGSLLKPRVMEPGRRYPVVVMVYGGPSVQTVLNLWQPNLIWNHLADRGIVVFQLDNRGTPGRGSAFEAPIYGRLGDVELADQIAGLDYLASLPFVDNTRVGIEGHSYGGMMTLLAMFKAPDRFKVGVAGASVVDQSLYDTGYTERYMGTPTTNPKGYADTDLTKLAPGLKGKLLVLHSMMDENVHFQNTALLIDALIAANKNFDLLILPGERHGFRNPQTRQYAFRRSVEYLVEHL